MDTFSRYNVEDTIFFNIQSVTEYGDIKEFESSEPEKYQTWLQMAKKRYANEFHEDDRSHNDTLNRLYLEKACFLPEFSKIVAISYGKPEMSEGKLNRNLRILKDEEETDLIINFMNFLNQEYSDGHNSSPKNIPMLCGHNITGHDIPLLVKRIIKYHEPFLSLGAVHVVPPIIKDYLKAKPWDSNILDTTNAWKFNGSDFISMQLISDFMGLKYTERLMQIEDINKFYWSGIEEEKDSTLETIRNQSVNYVNLAIQLVYKLGRL